VLLFVDRARGCIVLEHYTNDGTRTATLTGDDPATLVRLASEQRLVSRSDHAAYLAREVQRAADALRAGCGYVQDAAP
jgi:tetrahydromethanopterin S-methyltransferase subunit A